jgi:hypothetical protein
MNEDRIRIEKLEQQVATLMGGSRESGIRFFLKKSLTKGRILLGVGITVFFLATVVYAVSKPYDFVDGTVISAAEVNANFDILYARVNQLGNYANDDLDISWETPTGSFADIAGFSADIITTGGDLLVTVSMNLSLAAGSGYIRASLDGGRHSRAVTVYDTPIDVTAPYFLFANVPLGAHTVTVQSMVGGGGPFWIWGLDRGLRTSSLLVQEM